MSQSKKGFEKKQGVTRSVYLFCSLAIKIPSMYSWQMFLTGMLCNLQEREWWLQTKDPRLCPILFADKFGFFVIMRRAEPAIDWTFVHEKLAYFTNLPLDPNPTNFGFIKDKLVLVDYGS